MSAERGKLYIPEFAPTSDEALRSYVERELFRISSAITSLASGYVEETFVAPKKPRGGMIKLADGTYWNPGAGRGVYWYDENNATWNKL